MKGVGYVSDSLGKYLQTDYFACIRGVSMDRVKGTRNQEYDIIPMVAVV